jgi:hypothetical protein
VEYHPEERKIAEYTDVIQKNKKFCNIRVYRRWFLNTSTECSCGNSKEVIVEKILGLSHEFYRQTNQELGSTIGSSLVSISAKISEKSSI